MGEGRALVRVWRRENKAAAKNGGEWFRYDPAVRATIEADGWLGLGPEADRQFIEDRY